MSGDAGKGTNKGEKKAGNLVLSHVPWLTWLPVQVSSLRLAAASEAALIGILKLIGWQLQPAAASLWVFVLGVVFVAAAAMFGILTLGGNYCFLGFFLSLIEESDEYTAAVASVAALVASLCSSSCISGAHKFQELLGDVFRFNAASSILVPAVPVGTSDVEADEGLNRHVLAGGLFSGPRQGHSAASRSCKRNYLFLRQVTGWGVLCRQVGTPCHCRTSQATCCTQVWGL